MNATPLSVVANQNAPALRLALVITDPEVAHEIGQRAEGAARDDYARQALRLGVIALRQASGAFDTQSLQREGERMMASVRELLLERTGQVTEGVTKVLAQHVGQGSPLLKMLAPDQTNGLVATLARTIDGTLKAQTDQVLKQFSLDQPDSALSRLLRDVTASNAQFQTEVRATLDRFQARREEAARSTQHGNTFEASVGDFLRTEAARLCDVYEAVGTTTGHADRKTGDHVLTLNPDSGAPDARIVCEAKSKKGYTEKSALGEIALARKNRDAQVGLVVMDRSTTPPGVETLRRVGSDVLVVWDPEDVGSDLNLRLAVSVARALCVRERVASSEADANLEQIDRTIEAIADQIGVVDEIIRSGHLIAKRGAKVTKSAEKLREALEREVEGLQGLVKAVKKG